MWTDLLFKEQASSVCSVTTEHFLPLPFFLLCVMISKLFNVFESQWSPVPSNRTFLAQLRFLLFNKSLTLFLIKSVSYFRHQKQNFHQVTST